ncbi:MAG: hypothetical protein HY735_37855, partial [Verrucomicrobia bacterium]|nr:hypothetical protein [Verrucomicrobiota bacterium]
SGDGFYGVTGKVDVDGGINSPNFHLTGTLEGTNSLTGRMVWTTGTIKSKLTIAAGGVLELSGPDQKNLEENTIDNAGTMRWTGTGGLQSSTAVVINNQAGGVFEALNDASLQHFSQSVPAVFNNAGVFRKSVGTNVTLIQNVVFNNSGKVEIQSGTLDFSGDYPQSAGATILNGGTLKATAIKIDGGVLGGAGTVSGNVFNRAQVSPTTLSIEGDYSQSADGVLNFGIRGISAGSQFDTLTISGKAALDGSLNVLLTNAFQPRPGNSFQVMTYASRTGSFANVKGLDLGGGSALTADFRPTALVLSLPSPFTFSRTVDGLFKLRFEGATGVSYRLEASSDLVNWSPLAPTPAAGILEFTDAESAKLARRFYRVRALQP